MALTDYEKYVQGVPATPSKPQPPLPFKAPAPTPANPNRK